MIDNKVKKILVGLAIEHTLLKIDQNHLEKLEKKIRQKYNCSIADCYDHPEYLNETLEQVFGESGKKIRQSIEKYLREVTDEYSIEQFVKKISTA